MRKLIKSAWPKVSIFVAEFLAVLAFAALAYGLVVITLAAGG